MKNLKFLKLVLLLMTLGPAIAPVVRAENPPAPLKTEAKPYPLKTCLVCGMKLSMMGKPFEFVYQGQKIDLCDASEKADFDKDPKKYLKKLADAVAQQKRKK